MVLVIAGPSGVGKSSIVKALRDRVPALWWSVSATTRARRNGEIEGVHYQFVTDADFDRMIEDGELLEWAPIFGHRSGTLRGGIESAVKDGKSVLLEVDIEGARAIRRKLADAVLVFIAPPDMATLEARLRERGSESGERIAGRLERASLEMAAAPEFDHIVRNQSLVTAVDEIVAILDGPPRTQHPGPHDREDPSRRRIPAPTKDRRP